MRTCKGFSLTLLVLAALGSAAHAQIMLGDRPKPLVPLKPPTQQEVNQREALKLYVLGLLCEHDDRLLEALQAFQAAAKLDPDAAAVFKAQIPLLIALDRGNDALAASARVVQLDPGDYETWYIHGRLLKIAGKLAGARKALERGLTTDVVKEHPEVAQQMYYDLGSILESEGSVKQAADAFLRSAKILDHPDHIVDSGPFTREMVQSRAAEVYERIGHLYRKAQQYDRAIESFKLAQARFPASAGRLNFNLAQVYIDKQSPADALAALDAYLRFKPQELEAYELKIGLLQRLERSKEILPWLEQASQADAHNVRLKLLLANQLAAARLSARAEKLYLELTEKAPEPPIYRGLFELYKQDVRFGMGRVLAVTNKTFQRAANKDNASELASTQARAVLAALRDNGELCRELLKTALEALDQANNELKFETVHFLAVLADRHHRHDEAERFYRQCLRDAKPANEALIYGGLLRVLWKAHKYEEILKVCNEGLRASRATNHVLFRNDLARALARLDRYEEALQEVDKAVNVAGDNDRLAVRHLRVRILSQGNQHAKAEAECQAMLKESSLPGDIMEIRYLLSGVYTAAKQLDKAEEQLEAVLRFDPNNATANNDLGYLWADQSKNLPQAEELIRKALEQERRQRKLSPNVPAEDNHDNAAYLDSLGWVLFRRGQVEEARKELERATALDSGEDSTIWDHLGDVYFRLQMAREAHTAWQKSLELLEKERRRPPDTRADDIRRKLQLK